VKPEFFYPQRRWMFQYPARVVTPEVKGGWSNRAVVFAKDYSEACAALRCMTSGRKDFRGKSLDAGLFQLRTVSDER